jgi:hypothetical protein
MSGVLALVLAWESFSSHPFFLPGQTHQSSGVEPAFLTLAGQKWPLWELQLVKLLHLTPCRGKWVGELVVENMRQWQPRVPKQVTSPFWAARSGEAPS